MKTRPMVIIGLLGLSTQAQALPAEAVASFFSKLFKGGVVAKETVTAGRAAEGAAAAKGLEHLPAGEAAGHGTPALQAAIEPKPNTSAEPIAKSTRDAGAYKSLRTSAAKGDTEAMIRMANMTSSGKVSDPGEPYHGYWLFQASRAGNPAAIRLVGDECRQQDDQRRLDRWFDAACSSIDGRTLYFGSGFSGAFSPYRTAPTLPLR